MRVWILSDLHLEMSNGYAFKVPEDYDVVVVAGDFCHKKDFNKWKIDLFGNKPLIHCDGNHEFYGGDPLDHHNMVPEVREYDNVVFISATMWTDFKLYGAENADTYSHYAWRAMNDYNFIKTVDGHAISPRNTQVLFSATLDAIKGALEYYRDSDKKIVLVTHHGLLPQSIHEKYEGSALNPAFVSDQQQLFYDYRIDYYIHGHIHTPACFKFHNTEVICNPHGYWVAPGVLENPAFNSRLIIEI